MMESGRLSGQELADLNSAVAEVVRAEFTDAAIEKVLVEPTRDDDGDLYLRVTVVLKQNAKFDGAKAKGLVRHIFPALPDRARDWFPIVSFLSERDYTRVSATA